MQSPNPKPSAITKYLTTAAVLIALALFTAKFYGSSILQSYIVTGIGSCENIPILCRVPTEMISNPAVNRRYVSQLVPYDFLKMSISAPKEFNVTLEKIQKIYYKKHKRLHHGSVIYLVHEDKNFFMDLFPQLKSQGVNEDYEFIKRTMYARLDAVKTVQDAFFVIMKSVFIPDVGNQKTLKMAEFVFDGKKGFINYNIGSPDSYFDCNVFDRVGNFYKIYIKDKQEELDLDKVFAIISTIK